MLHISFSLGRGGGNLQSPRGLGGLGLPFGLTLSAVIQEEFALDIDPRVLPTLDSYESFRAYVCQAHPKDEESVG